MKPMATACFAAVGIAALVLLSCASPAQGTVFNSDCTTKTHNFYLGQRTPADIPVHMEHLKLPSKWLRKISYDVIYPPKWETGKVITYIEGLDQKSDGTGACIFLRNGGVGQTSVTLHVKSLWNHGIDFWIKIYAR